MKALYDQYLEDEINVVKNEVLGTASGYFAKNNLGELAVSTMLEFGSEQGARVAFHNTGGVRSTISEGTVTYGDIYKVFPFDNELIIVDVTGVELKWWLAQGNYVAGADEFTNTFANGDPIDNSSVYKIISINYLTEKHLTEEDQYPHNEDTIINTFAYVRELIKARWQDQGSLDPSDYIG
jgi:2',3'-cyclic-nucleotide 2'-phosphodiesterase (5'-nucleotidase family)